MIMKWRHFAPVSPHLEIFRGFKFSFGSTHAVSFTATGTYVTRIRGQGLVSSTSAALRRFLAERNSTKQSKEAMHQLTILTDDILLQGTCTFSLGGPTGKGHLQNTGTSNQNLHAFLLLIGLNRTPSS